MRVFLLKTVFVFCVLLSLLQVSGAAAQEGGDQFQEASSAYSRGDYPTAIKLYESLTMDGVSAPLFYNLANSYAQAGKSGKAILNYERALRLAPGDPDIRANLDLVRKEKGLFQEEQSVQRHFVNLLGLNQWLGVLALSLVALALLLLLPASRSLKQSFRYGIAVATLFLGCLAAVCAVGQYGSWNDGVVVESGARLRISPFDSAASVGMIQEGRLLRPGKRHNEYVLVTDESGRSGWLKDSSFEVITAIP